jgi:hypothetical protein
MMKDFILISIVLACAHCVWPVMAACETDPMELATSPLPILLGNSYHKKIHITIPTLTPYSSLYAAISKDPSSRSADDDYIIDDLRMTSGQDVISHLIL